MTPPATDGQVTAFLFTAVLIFAVLAGAALIAAWHNRDRRGDDE